MNEQSFGQRLIHRIRKVLFGIFTFFASIGVLVTLLFGLGVYYVAQHVQDVQIDSSFPSAKELEENSLVEIDLDGPLVVAAQEPRDLLWSKILGGDVPVSLSSLQRTLKRAASDERVSALLLEMKELNASFALASELRSSLEDFKASGKPIYVNLVNANSLSYYLASVADQINLPPIGGVLIPGPVFSLTYFRSALEKLGLNLEVFRAGRYKSAFEPFVADEPSQASLEMYQDLEGSLRNHMVEAIASSRKKSSEEVRAWLGQSAYTSEKALAAGIVDRIGYRDEWFDELKEKGAFKQQLGWLSYHRQSQELDEKYIATDSKDEIALIEAAGEIRMQSAPSGEPMITPESMIKRLKWAKERDQIKAVVLRIESPGGSAVASDIIWNHVKELSKSKPVVVSMGSVAASGGYYIAAPASRILASATTITGSIGVIGASLTGPGFQDKYGVSFHTITQSERKDYFDFASAPSQSDRETMAAGIDEVYQTFINKVAEGRKTDPAAIDRIAQGRVYTGQRALQIGLVDKIGGLRDAFREAKELAKLDPDKYYPMATYKGESRNLLDCLAANKDILRCSHFLQGRLSTLVGVSHPLLGSFLQPAEKLAQMLDEDRFLSLWTGKLTWR